MDTAYTGETVSGEAEYEAACKAAEDIGKEHGKAAGSWVVDGNSSTETLRHIIGLSDEGELLASLNISAPLSGEWADGYSLGQLSDDVGVDEDSDGFDDICAAYEDAYYDAVEAEAVRSARAMLPDDDGKE